MSKNLTLLGMEFDSAFDLFRAFVGCLIFLAVIAAIIFSIVDGFLPDKDSDVKQSYWYCWDTGDSSPHHLGHHVSGDHYCTVGELRSAGK